MLERKMSIMSFVRLDMNMKEVYLNVYIVSLCDVFL